MVQEKGRSSNRSVSSLSLSNTQKTACSGSKPTPLLHLNQVQWMFHVCLQHLNKEPLRIGLAMGYYSAIKKNTFESVLMRWMKLEPIIHSEVSQKEKHQYSILMHIYAT